MVRTDIFVPRALNCAVDNEEIAEDVKLWSCVLDKLAIWVVVKATALFANTASACGFESVDRLVKGNEIEAI